jgi:hypothetical protein
MNSAHVDRIEYAVAQDAARYLEAQQPDSALNLLRQLIPTQCDGDDPCELNLDRELRELRSCLVRAAEEIQHHYPGHALRTLRIAIGRAPLG